MILSGSRAQKMYWSPAQAGLGFRLPGNKVCGDGGSDGAGEGGDATQIQGPPACVTARSVS